MLTFNLGYKVAVVHLKMEFLHSGLGTSLAEPSIL